MLVMLNVILDMFLPNYRQKTVKAFSIIAVWIMKCPTLAILYWVITYISFTVGYVTLRGTLGINALSPEQDGHLYEQYIFESIFLNNELKIFKWIYL